MSTSGGFSRSMPTIYGDKPKDSPFKSWWRKLLDGGRGKGDKAGKTEPRVFEVALTESIQLASIPVSYVDDTTGQQCYGFVPIIVGKCGSFLKDQGIYTEGIFRLSGSAKRIAQLQTIFNTPPHYGANFDWTGFTVHDAANVLRRYLNYLPIPVVTFELYDDFRNGIDLDISLEDKIAHFQSLITKLPPAHQFLLLYILDLMAVFAAQAKNNRMTISNLASVFTPAILAHPDHDMQPGEYRRSQRVIEFMLEFQGCFTMTNETVQATKLSILNQELSGPISVDRVWSQHGQQTLPSASDRIMAEQLARQVKAAEGKGKESPTKRLTVASSSEQKAIQQPIQIVVANNTPGPTTTLSSPRSPRSTISAEFFHPIVLPLHIPPSRRKDSALSMGGEREGGVALRRAKTMPSKVYRHKPERDLQVVHLARYTYVERANTSRKMEKPMPMRSMTVPSRRPREASRSERKEQDEEAAGKDIGKKSMETSDDSRASPEEHREWGQSPPTQSVASSGYRFIGVTEATSSSSSAHTSPSAVKSGLVGQGNRQTGFNSTTTLSSTHYPSSLSAAMSKQPYAEIKDAGEDVPPSPDNRLPSGISLGIQKASARHARSQSQSNTPSKPFPPSTPSTTGSPLNKGLRRLSFIFNPSPVRTDQVSLGPKRELQEDILSAPMQGNSPRSILRSSTSSPLPTSPVAGSPTGVAGFKGFLHSLGRGTQVRRTSGGSSPLS